MNTNIGTQTAGTVAWNGAVGRAADIRKYTQFGWSFEVTAAVAADAVFTVQSAPPSVADACLPGAFTDVPATPICGGGAVVGAATVTIPAGTAIGSLCHGTIPCRPDAFVRLVGTSGTIASVNAVLLRDGPMA